MIFASLCRSEWLHGPLRLVGYCSIPGSIRGKTHHMPKQAFRRYTEVFESLESLMVGRYSSRIRSLGCMRWPRFIRTFLPRTTACCFSIFTPTSPAEKLAFHSLKTTKDRLTDSGSGCLLSVCSRLHLCLQLPQSSGCLPHQYGSVGLECRQPAGLRWSRDQRQQR